MLVDKHGEYRVRHRFIETGAAYFRLVEVREYADRDREWRGQPIYLHQSSTHLAAAFRIYCDAQFLLMDALTAHPATP